MSRLGLWLVETINSLFPALQFMHELDIAKSSDKSYQERDYAEAKRSCSEFGTHWNITGKDILDVGAGLGGKATYYAEQRAKRVTGIDLDMYCLVAAASLAHRREQQSTVRLLAADAACMPFRNESFDVIVSVNTFEHVEDLAGTLAECKRVLRPEGLMFLHFPPFYSPWGAHLEGWIDFPWPHVFFSDQTLIRAAQKVEETRKNNLNYIPPARVDWAQIECLPGLNRTTVRQFLHLIHSLNLIIVESRMLPLARNYLASRGPLARGVLTALKILSTVPVLREFLTTKMVFVLRKA